MSAVLVTGASSGLGRAACLQLGSRGHEVGLLARDRGRLEAVARAVGDAGGLPVVIESDVTDEERLTRDLDEALGDRPLALVLHAAGVLELAALAELDARSLRRMLDVNVVGTLAVVRATRERLVAGRGRLAVVSSIAGRIPLPGGFSGYAASKWAVRGWVETVRPELEAEGIGVTACYPSILDTPMVRDLAAAPPVYRAFPWHPPEKAARAILRDVARGRPESYVTWSDRLAARLSGIAPRAFAAGFHAWVRWRGGRSQG